MNEWKEGTIKIWTTKALYSIPWQFDSLDLIWLNLRGLHWKIFWITQLSLVWIFVIICLNLTNLLFWTQMVKELANWSLNRDHPVFGITSKLNWVSWCSMRLIYERFLFLVDLMEVVAGVCCYIEKYVIIVNYSIYAVRVLIEEKES